MANRYENERSASGYRDEEFRNRGRSEWDDDHGNGSGHGRGYGRARFDEDNDQGRYSSQGYYDDRFNDRAAGSRSGRFDRGWSDPMPYDESEYGASRGGGNLGRGGYDQSFGQRSRQDFGRYQEHGPGWRNEQQYGPQRRSGGFGGGSTGYGANRDFRSDRFRDYGGADMNFGDHRYGYGGGDFGQQGSDQGRFGQGGMTGQTAYGTGSGLNRDFGRESGPYSTDWAQSGQMGGHPDEDYHHWRSQQVGKFDKDYQDWRSERRKKFSEDFESWRASRPQNPNDEHLANANPKNPSSISNMGNTNPATGSSPSGSSRDK